MISRQFAILYRKAAGMVGRESGLGEITLLLQNWKAKRGDEQTRLLELIYPELKRVAEARMRKERSDHTLQPTALVNEFIVQLCGKNEFIWRDRAHFLAVASRAMRRILVDHARGRNSLKRGSGAYKLQLDQVESSGASNAVDI